MLGPGTQRMHPRVLNELADVVVKPLQKDIQKVMVVGGSPGCLEKGKHSTHF